MNETCDLRTGICGDTTSETTDTGIMDFSAIMKEKESQKKEQSE